MSLSYNEMANSVILATSFRGIGKDTTEAPSTVNILRWIVKSSVSLRTVYPFEMIVAKKVEIDWDDGRFDTYNDIDTLNGDALPVHVYYSNARTNEPFIKCTITHITGMRLFPDVNSIERVEAIIYAKYLTSMYRMFYGVSSIYLTVFNTSGVTDMGFMCYLTNVLSIKGLNTLNVINFDSMFYTTTIATPELRLDMSNAQTAQNMIQYTQIETIDIIHSNNMVSMQKMFYGASGLQIVKNLDTSSAQNLSELFYKCIKLITIPTLKTAALINGNRMFCGCILIDNINITDISHLNSTSEMFFNCKNLKSLTLGGDSTSSSFTIDLTTTALNKNTLESLFNSLPNNSGGYSNTLDILQGVYIQLTNEQKLLASNKHWSLNYFITFKVLISSSTTTKVIPFADLVATGVYVDWGDGTINTYISATNATLVHTYAKATEYQKILYIKMRFTTISTIRTQEHTSSNLSISQPISAIEDYLPINSTTIINKLFYNTLYLITLPYFNCVGRTDLSNCFAGSGVINLPSYDFSTLATASSLFSDCVNMTNTDDLNFISALSIHNLFYNCKKLNNIKSLNTPIITDSTSAFSGCSSLVSAPWFNTSNIEDADDFNTVRIAHLSGLYSGCTLLQNIPILDTQKVKYFDNMFSNCTNLKVLPLINMNNANTINYICFMDTLLESIPLYNWDNVILASYAFYECNTLSEFPVIQFNSCIDISYMFYNCFNLIQCNIKNTASIKTYTKAFMGCSKLSSLSIDISSAEKTHLIFHGCQSLLSLLLTGTTLIKNIELNLSTLNLTLTAFTETLNNLPSTNTTYGYLILKNEVFNLLDASVKNEVTNKGWKLFNAYDYSVFTVTINVQTIGTSYSIGIYGTLIYVDWGDGNTNVYANTTSDISHIYTTIGTYLITYWTEAEYKGYFTKIITFTGNYVSEGVTSLFDNCTTVTSINLTLRNLEENIMNGFYMFRGCTNLTSLTLNSFVPKYTAYMYSNCMSLTNVPSMNLSEIQHSEYMFNECTNLVSVDNIIFSTISPWYCSGMFYKCTKLLQVINFPLCNAIGTISSIFFNCMSMTTLTFTGGQMLYNNNYLLLDTTALTPTSIIDTFNTLPLGYPNGLSEIRLSVALYNVLPSTTINIAISKGWTVVAA